MDKNQKLRFIHYTDPIAKKNTCIWGQEKPGLLFDYDDRLMGWDGHEAGKERAESSEYKQGAAGWWEEYLRGHTGDNGLTLHCVMSGCNWASGYQWFAFGYRMTPKKPSSPAASPQE